MDKIINLLYEAYEPLEITEEEEQIKEKSADILNYAQSVMTAKDFDRLWDVAIQIGTASNRESFKRGFCAAVQLILAAMQPIDGHAG